MPHIIFLFLLIASPSFYTLGDETASWGNIQPGPSESECRPYIEKALQGANIQDSLNEPRDTDDVGESEKQEEDAEVTEVLEDVPPDLLVPTNESEENLEVDVQSEVVSDEQEQSTEESAEITPQKEEIEENVSVSQVSQETNSNEEEEKQVIQEITSSEPNEETIEENDLDSQIDTESDEHEVVKQSEAETITEAEHEAGEEEKLTESVEETAEATVEAESESELEKNEELDLETASVTETENENQEAESNDGSKEQEEDQSNESPTEEKTVQKEETNEQLNEIEEKEAKDESAEAVDLSSISDETQTEKVEITETSDDTQTEKVETTETSDDTQTETFETTETSDERETEAEQSEEERSLGKESDEITESVETLQEEVLEKKPDEEQNLPTNSEEDSGNQSNEMAVNTTDKKEILSEEKDSQISVEETPKNIDDLQESHSSDKEEKKNEELLDSKEEILKEETTQEGDVKTEDATPEEELSMIMEIPANLRSREHMIQILRLSSENEEIEKSLGKIAESTLRELKKLYDIAIKPLEILYKYRDLSNRHFGDPEIFSKPLILFMGPWSGGKSTIINYLLENEYKKTALRTGAEPSPAYFNIVMWGEIEEILDGTQLAADWTFSGLQKFGQGLLDRLRGLKLNHPLLEKVNIVEIPGILEIRKQVERLFPFNDACQWFIDRADIIFLVYDPSKLDVGPETEAILDQLKGREMQTRIILNKADQVKPEELMRVQGTLIWNISPLMSSTEPPVMYSTSLWSIPYENGSPTRLLYAQERSFLKDLRDAVDKRVENKIASARRFAVRVRNHAKMVDCYLTTYYNHKSFFGNKKKISDDIIEHPQNYHIYEGLSTLTNISRYDLPDPDVYRDFFRLNPVYEFQQLSSTCTYFKGCPINRLDVAIAYDLPELVGKYKKHVEEVINYSKKIT